MLCWPDKDACTEIDNVDKMQWNWEVTDKFYHVMKRKAVLFLVKSGPLYANFYSLSSIFCPNGKHIYFTGESIQEYSGEVVECLSWDYKNPS